MVTELASELPCKLYRWLSAFECITVLLHTCN